MVGIWGSCNTVNSLLMVCWRCMLSVYFAGKIMYTCLCVEWSVLPSRSLETLYWSAIWSPEVRKNIVITHILEQVVNVTHFHLPCVIDITLTQSLRAALWSEVFPRSLAFIARNYHMCLLNYAHNWVYVDVWWTKHHLFIMYSQKSVWVGQGRARRTVINA